MEMASFGHSGFPRPHSLTGFDCAPDAAGEIERDGSGTAARVLVVDDSPTFRRTIGGMLERAGYRVETSPSSGGAVPGTGPSKLRR